MHWRKSFKIVLLTLIVLGVGLLGGSYYLIRYSLDPEEGMYDEPTVYDNYASSHPIQQAWMDSIRSTGALRDSFLLNRHGERQHVYFLPAPNPTRRTAFLIHGYHDSAISMMHIAHFYHHELGYNLFLPDLRSHGLSEGNHVQMGWFDHYDVLPLLSVADSLFGGDTRMVVHGVSMGAATTMMLSGEQTPSFVRCFVEDCGYTSTWDEFEGEMHQRFGLPAFPLLHLGSILCKVIYGWDFWEASSVDQVRKCTKPMLFIHGDADTFVPTWMVNVVYEAKPGAKNMWLAPGSAHADSFDDHREEYISHLSHFLEQSEM